MEHRTGSAAAEWKTTLRRSLSAARASRPPEAGQAALQLAAVLGDARVVASYNSFGSEASTVEWHKTLGDVELLLPRLLPAGDLELAGGPTVPGLRGTVAPTGPVVPWSEADLVVVPALAVSRSGIRLGRGGGSYDRALRRVRPDVLIVALVTDESELLDELPSEPHDVPVGAVALPGRLVLLR